MTKKIEFDDSRASSFRKRCDVLAFRSDDPFVFLKPWGTQKNERNAWVIVPLDENGDVTGGLFGCAASEFERTYKQCEPIGANRYKKTVTVRAYQPGFTFEVDTVLSNGWMEVSGSRALRPDAWVVRAPGGEIYPVENEEFVRCYVASSPSGE